MVGSTGIRWTRHLLFLFGFIFCSALHALGFGPTKVYSYLNQPLSSEIKIFGADNYNPSEIIVHLASPESFAQAKIARPFYLTKLEFDVVKTKRNGMFVYISSKQPIQQPMVEFIVELISPDGKMVREITFFLDPAPPNSTTTNGPEPLSWSESSSIHGYREIPDHKSPPPPPPRKKTMTAEEFNHKVADNLLDKVKEVETEQVMPAEHSISSDMGHKSADLVANTPKAVMETASTMQAPMAEEASKVMTAPPAPPAPSAPTAPVTAEDKVMSDMFSSTDMPKTVNASDSMMFGDDEPENVRNQGKIEKISKMTDMSSAAEESGMLDKAYMQKTGKAHPISWIKRILGDKNLVYSFCAIIAVLALIIIYALAMKRRRKPSSDVGSDIEEDSLGDDVSLEEPTFVTDGVATIEEDDEFSEEPLEDDVEELSEEEESGDQFVVKLELAQQYIDIGEVDSATELLQELLTIGDDETQAKAKEMLDQL